MLWKPMQILNLKIPRCRLAYRDYILLFFFFTFLMFIRLFALSADPSPSFSIGFISDEGWWVHNSRQAAIFGHWLLDDFNQGLLISPTFSLSCYCCFKLLGVHFFSARLTSALAGFACLIISFVWLKLAGGEQKSGMGPVLATLFIGWNFFFLSFNRIALVDTLLVFFLLLGVFFLDLKKRMFAFGAGLVLWAAMLTKPSALFIYPVIVVVWLWDWHKGYFEIRKVIFFISASLGSFLVWLCLMYPEYLDQFISLNLRFSKDNFPSSPVQMLLGVVTFFFRFEMGNLYLTRFIAQAPLLFCFSCWLGLGFMNKVVGEGLWQTLSHLRRWQVIMGLWLVIGVVFLMPNQYKPERRFLFLIPPMALLMADLIGTWFTSPRISLTLADIFNCSQRVLMRRMTAILFPGPLVVLGTPYLSRTVLPQTEGLGGHSWLYVACIFLSLYFVAGTLSGFIFLRWTPRALNLRRIAISLLMVFLFGHSLSYLDLYRHLSWTMKDTSQKLGEHFTEGTVVMGGVADTLCMENRAFTFTPFEVGGGVKFNQEPLKRFKPKFMLAIHQIGDIVLPDDDVRPFENVLEMMDRLTILPDREGKPRVIVDWFRFREEPFSLLTKKEISAGCLK
ncbi:hypothetical protein ACFL27_01250 [candidate division CSSED10-310 bacterium]|uniref:Glycosyltransferase RgtA/B/C/D-like domain-containing protein n=1 Tax=candidate division CSSED10-310 bacterium TaxID=2855610 RepID=A0ABV6YRG9_UNCC1